MSASHIMQQLQSLGIESYRNTLLRHGANDPVFGVKIEEMKKLIKAYKNDVAVACALYNTGNYDAQYLAGLLVDGALLGKAQLQHWAETANSNPIRQNTVAWVTAESSYALDLINEWGSSGQPELVAIAWASLNSYISVTPDDKLDLAWLRQLLDYVKVNIHQQENKVRSIMNGFVIALGSYVAPLTQDAIAAGEAIGPVSVDVGDTACKVAYSPESIRKIQQRGSIGKKRKTTKC